MLKETSKKCLCGLIIITIVSIFTSCANNKPIKPVDKDIVADSIKVSNESPEPSADSAKTINELSVTSKDTAKNNNQILDSWVGDYIFTEHINSKDYTKFYEVFISKENNNYNAIIKTHDEGEGVYSYVKAKVKGDTNHLDFIFDDYLPDETNTNKPYNLDDNLLSFTKTDRGVRTHWGKIVPNNDIDKVDGVYFKRRENSEGYIGNWYTSIPDTGGNSTTIEIKEMSNESVSFNLYYCRTYKYDGINIKLENNIAKFDDSNGDYKTSGTIEFGSKSIIVNIEKTNLPILKTGKTIFNYKVNKFNVVNMIPHMKATDVELDRGIELDFDRRISPTVNPAVMIEKANTPEGSEGSFVEMNVEIKDNKIIFLPNYDAMKSFKEVIESGQKYKLIINKGQYRDEVGNINDDIVLEFTSKK